VDLLIDYLVLVLHIDHVVLLQHYHTLVVGEHLHHLQHYVNHLSNLLHHHLQLVVEPNLHDLGQNHFYLAIVFEEEHSPELTPELSPISSQYPQFFDLQQTQCHGFSRHFFLLDHTLRLLCQSPGYRENEPLVHFLQVSN
jgi:hypothetical protein